MQMPASLLLIAILWLLGLSWILLLDLHRGRRLLGILVLSLGVGLSLLSLSLVSLALLNVASTEWVIPISLATSSIALVLRIGKSRMISKASIISKAEAGSLLLFLLHACLWVLYFWNHPFFPTNQSPDPLQHATRIQAVAQGRTADLLSTGYATGLHFMLGFVVRDMQDQLLITLRQFMAFLESMTVLLVYVVSSSVVTKKGAVLSALTYAVILPLGIMQFTDPGIYANMLADFLLLTAFCFLGDAFESKRLRDYLTLTLIGGGLLLSHPTSLIFLNFAWLFSSIVALFYRKRLGTYLSAISSLTLIPALALLVLPQIPMRALSLLSTSLSIPTSLYVICEVWFSNVKFTLGLPAALVIVLTIVLHCWKKGRDTEIALASDRAIWAPFLFGWFFYAWALSVLGGDIWRLVLHSLVPGVFILGIGLSGPIWRACNRVSKVAISRLAQQSLSRAMLLFVIIGILVGGPAARLFNEFLGSGQRDRQIGIYESMRWAKENTASDALFASIRLPEYAYLPVTAYRRFQGNYEISFDDTVGLLTTERIQYMAVPAQELEKTALPWGLSVAFRNQHVAVLKLNSTLNNATIC